MELIALTKNGDTKHTFNPADPSDVAQARIVFDDYRRSGYSAFRVEVGKNTPLTAFDPDAGTVLFVPMLVGG